MIWLFDRFIPILPLEQTILWILPKNSQYVSAYIPIWYVGSSGSAFAMDSFTSNLNSLSSSISAAMTPSSSGSGGGGW